jgi:DNA repair exonuclease SbcCD ATPase subunit
MSDILGKFAKKESAEGAANAAPAPNRLSTSTSGELERGINMIDKLGAKPLESANAANAGQASADNSSASREVEPSGTEPNVSTSNSDWTTESALKEVKKLREENKTVRVKYQEQIQSIKAEQDARVEAQKQELAKLNQAKDELDKLKAEQEDKKRDLVEKVAHREAKLAELQSMMSAKESEYQRKISEMDGIVKQYQAEQEAETEVYRSRINEEINKIPEKFRDYASLIVKGSGDARDALLALNEAKLKGMFEEKTVVVNHSVPGAKDGARTTQERMQQANEAQRSSMTSSQKIKSGLEKIRSGTPNSAFRMK